MRIQIYLLLVKLSRTDEPVQRFISRRIRRKRDQQEHGSRGNRKRGMNSSESQQDNLRVPQGLSHGLLQALLLVNLAQVFVGNTVDGKKNPPP